MMNCLIFDFDGVIINSHNLQVKALNEAFRKIVGQGIPPYEEFFKNSGDSLTNIFKKLNLPMEMLPIYKEVSSSNIDMIKIHNGMEQLLKHFIDRGYCLALCTGKERQRTLNILKYLHIDKFFRSVVCSDDVKNPKPHPESLEKCIKTLKGTSQTSIMIGDGINDILCAKKADVSSIAVTWGDVPKKDIVKVFPDAIAENVYELKDKIEEIAIDLRSEYEKNKCRA